MFTPHAANTVTGPTFCRSFRSVAGAGHAGILHPLSILRFMVHQSWIICRLRELWQLCKGPSRIVRIHHRHRKPHMNQNVISHDRFWRVVQADFSANVAESYGGAPQTKILLLEDGPEFCRVLPDTCPYLFPTFKRAEPNPGHSVAVRWWVLQRG